MRIAHVTDCFAPRTGGIETQVHGLVIGQSAQGHDVRVITATPNRSHRSSDIRVTRITTPLPYDLPVHLRAHHMISRNLREQPVDVLHIHVGAASPFAWGAVRVARELKVPTVITVHSVWDPLTTAGYNVLAKSPWRFDPRMVLTAVGSSAAVLVRQALPAHPYVGVLPNGIDVEQWRVARSPRPVGHVRLISVLRLAPRKRAIPLVRAIGAAVQRTAGAVSATLIGDGPDRRRVERLVDRMNLRSHITLTGHVSHDRLPEYFANADIFCQASIRESFGIAALEARAAGLAIIAMRGSGTADFIRDGVEGRLVPADSAMTEAIVELTKHPVVLENMISHNESSPPAQSWPHVLKAAANFYAQAQSRR